MNGLPQINLPDNMIHLGLGQPGSDLLPLDRIREAAGEALGETDHHLLAYGATRGNPDFRESLAGFLEENSGIPVTPDELFITNGNSQALDMICSLLTRPGDTVLVEAPSYFLALRIFADHGLNLVPVPMDGQGLRVDRLEEILASVTPAFLYTIPFFHNPTGITMSETRQADLAKVAERRHLKIVADEVYWFLHSGKTPPPSLGRLWGRIPVFSLGSFSKILAPGLRLGWIHTSPDAVKLFSGSGLLQSGGGLNPVTSAMVNHVIRSGGLLEQIDTYRGVYGRRRETFCRMLRTELPPCVRVPEPDGGYFIWLEFPEGTDLFALRKQIQAHDVDVYPGPYFDPESAPGRGSNSRFANCIRLSFTLYTTRELTEGTARLGRALREVLPELYH